MLRKRTEKRDSWIQRCESVGFTHHTLDGSPYWREGIYYAFSMEEVEEVSSATLELHSLCLEAVDHVLSKERLDQLGIPKILHPLIYTSWEADEEGLYGRFDLRYAGLNQGAPKMFEYNADTPTSLLEAAVVQWNWLEDTFPHLDQFNFIHEALIGNWKYFYPKHGPVCHFAGLFASLEDFNTTAYLADTALQAGFDVELIDITQVGFDHDRRQFIDSECRSITNMFKLYPWEWMAKESYSFFLGESRTRWLEPPWKLVMSSKGLLAVLWELFPNHPNLLPASFEPDALASYGNIVRKPMLSREGAHVSLFNGSRAELESAGAGVPETFIYQKRLDLPDHDGVFPILGSWMIGDEAAGLGIREDPCRITGNTSFFVPHLIDGG